MKMIYNPLELGVLPQKKIRPKYIIDDDFPIYRQK
jgi:hypothetical protein